MKRLSKMLLILMTTILVITALGVTVLRLMLPHVNSYRPQIEQKITTLVGVPVKIGQIQAAWHSYGPEFELENVDIVLKGHFFHAKRIALSLDIWRTLLYGRWQLSNVVVTHSQLQLKKAFFQSNKVRRSAVIQKLQQFFLQQITYLHLQDSQILLFDPANALLECDIPKFSWRNSGRRHRAEGKMYLRSEQSGQGQLEVKLDLRDQQGILDHGQMYFQLDNANLKPWLNQSLKKQVGLKKASANITTWLILQRGELKKSYIQVKKGTLEWQSQQKTHHLALDKLDILAQKNAAHGWQVDLPDLKVSTDGQVWPQGKFQLLWLPSVFDQRTHQLLSAQLRIRANDLVLQRISPITSLYTSLPGVPFKKWIPPQMSGYIDSLALDIPLEQPENSVFDVTWHDIAWNNFTGLPAIKHFSGKAVGTRFSGVAQLSLADEKISLDDLFPCPLAIYQANSSLKWQRDRQNGVELWMKNMDIRGQALWLKGDAHLILPTQGTPYLGILAGIRLDSAKEAWRYFPKKWMSQPLIHYLTGALQGGKVDNATLIYAGDPHLFPYQQHTGTFQVFVPVREANFQFAPHWPALKEATIDLNFKNDGLFMSAPELQLDHISARQVKANIPHYAEHKLLVQADLIGEGQDIHHYFNETPLKNSVGVALDNLVLQGKVKGNLQLDIPLKEQGKVNARGTVILEDNQLSIVPLKTKLNGVKGQFHYVNGTLKSDQLSASWFGLPVKLHFATQPNIDAYKVEVGMTGEWPVTSLPGLPDVLRTRLSGQDRWRGKLELYLPAQKELYYRADINADLANIGSQLPAPLAKKEGQPLTVQLIANGNKQEFTLNGIAPHTGSFSSEWKIRPKTGLKLSRAVWKTGAIKPPILPREEAITLQLPALVGTSWLPFLTAQQQHLRFHALPFSLPTTFALETPSLNFAGQNWQNLRLKIKGVAQGTQIDLHATQVDGHILMTPDQKWIFSVNYLYYNPEQGSITNKITEKTDVLDANFNHWPRQLKWMCRDCWFLGQHVGEMLADLRVEGDSLIVKQGTINVGGTHLAFNGAWGQHKGKNISHLKGVLSGKSIENSTQYFGITTPLRDAPFNINFAADWQGLPWKPKWKTVTGNINLELGQGEIENLGGGRVGQLLSLVSLDALLRKLRFDFRDTFGSSFYFDRIYGKGTIRNGRFLSDGILIDGGSADITLSGNIDFEPKLLNIQAVVVPHLSTTVGVAGALAVNPVFGAAVFAASKLFGSLWDKMSFIRYHIGGHFDKPVVEQVLLQPKGKERDGKG